MTKNHPTLQALAVDIRTQILRDVEDARLRELGASIIAKYKVPARNPQLLARAFQLFAQRIKFFREYPEVNAAPWITAQWGIGDCDDKSRLIAALLKSFRIPVRLTYITFYDGKQSMSHVWPEARLDDAGIGPWQALESVREWPIGKSALDNILRKGYPHNIFSMEI